MKKKDERVFILYIVLAVFLMLKTFVFIPVSVETFTYLINPIFWIIILIYCFIAFKTMYGRYKNKQDKIQLIIILLLIYLILYFSSGLFIGYERSPYSHTLLSIIKNIFAFIVVIACQEYTRFSLIKKSSKKISNYIFIALLFTVIEINFTEFTAGFSSLTNAIEYISSNLLPLIAKNTLLTYLVVTSGYIPALVYQVFMSLITILLPIFPKFNWFITGSLGLILPFITYMLINNFIEKRNTKFTNGKLKAKRSINSIPIFLIIIIAIPFFYGSFKYRPIGVMSNSMYPTFQRGDAVIIETINDKNISKIKVGTIIMYNLDGAAVIHRVIKITDNNGIIYYETKGDNNELPDNNLVEQKQVLGIERASIPKIGYPSVLLQSIISNQEVGVET